MAHEIKIDLNLLTADDAMEVLNRILDPVAKKPLPTQEEQDVLDALGKIHNFLINAKAPTGTVYIGSIGSTEFLRRYLHGSNAVVQAINPDKMRKDWDVEIMGSIKDAELIGDMVIIKDFDLKGASLTPEAVKGLMTRYTILQKNNLEPYMLRSWKDLNESWTRAEAEVRKADLLAKFSHCSFSIEEIKNDSHADSNSKRDTAS